MELELRKKLDAAIDVIYEAVELYGNRLSLSYSGGKDSKCLRRLVGLVFPNIITIHNEHEGESIEGTNTLGILVVKGPKSNVPKFLDLVHMEAMLDGTRQDEDKTVMIDGIDIHRSLMTSYKTINGLFGKTVYFPIWQLTEEEVLEVLGMHPIEFGSLRKNYLQNLKMG